jgi:hypothetical protein
MRILFAFLKLRKGYIVLFAIAASAATGYWRGAQVTRNAIEAATARDERVAQIVYDNALAAAAAEIAKIEIVNQTIRQELEREVRVETVYGECRHTDDAKRLLDAALAGEAPAEPVDSD